MKKKIIVRGPALSRSGYGEQTRFALRALRAYQDRFDIYLINTEWGKTSWIFEDNEERQWIDHIIIKLGTYNGPFDLSLQITIPNEWEKMAPINIGYTAGIETTKVAPEWIEKADLMDKIITISNHSKQVYENTVYPAQISQTNEPVFTKCRTPIHVVHYPVRSFDATNIDLSLETDFNFLTVAQWGPRKNVENTIRWFVEEFIDQPIGLIVKMFLINNSTIDKFHTENKINEILSQYPQKKCKVYLIHGDMTDEEMTGLYTHKKIKAMVSLTHGEGFGLPLFEAAYNGMPVIAPNWSGHCDFLNMPIEKKGKIKIRPAFAKIDYDLKPIHKSAIWNGVLQAESMWCYPKQGSYKIKLREVYKEYGRFKSQANKLKKYILQNFNKEEKYKQFADLVCAEQKLEEAEYVFVSDFFKEQLQGGAELSLQTLIDTCPSSYVKINSLSLTKKIIDFYKDSKWIFGNFINAPADLLALFKDGDMDYSFIEFDYKFCKHRNPLLYKFVEGEECSYADTAPGKFIADFILNAKSVFFMSEAQKAIYEKYFPQILEAKCHILSSVFDDQFFEKIENLNKKYKTTQKDKWLVLGSQSWVKGVEQSKQWCEENKLDYEVVADLEYDQFLEKLASSKGICFKPFGLDTCPRYVIEAKLLDCEMSLNENVQHTNEAWWLSSNDNIKTYLQFRKDYFWQKSFN